MSEIAEDMVEGACCAHCGVYFEEDHGYPVLCKSCHKADRGESQLDKATNKEL